MLKILAYYYNIYMYMKVKKYQVIMTKIDLTCSILGTFSDRPNALNFVFNYAMSNLNVDNINIKAIVNTDGNIGIYECHKIFKKTMMSQITVAEYIEDCECYEAVHTEYEPIK